MFPALSHKNINLLNAVFLFALLNLLFILVLRIFLIFSWSANIGGMEHNVVYSICKSLYGLPLYSDPESHNFDIAQYSPGYYYFIIFLCKLFSLSPFEDLHSIYIIGRTVSLLLNLAGFIVLFQMLRKVLTIDLRISAIACATGFIYLTRIQFSVRPDALYCFCFVLILYVFSKFFINGRSHLFLTGILLCALSVFVKQSGIGFPLLLSSFFLLTGNYRRFLSALMISIVTIALLSALFYVVYGVQFFKNVFGGLNNGVSLYHGYALLNQLFLHAPLVLVMATLGSVGFFRRKNELFERFFTYSSMFLFVFALVTSLKKGSWINYYNEFVIIVIVYSAWYINKLRNNTSDAERKSRIISVIFAAYLFWLLPSIIADKALEEHHAHLKESPESYLETKEIARHLNLILKEEPDTYFLSFNPHLNSMLASKAVVPNNDIVPDKSPFDYSGFKSLFSAGKVRYIVVPVNSDIQSFLGCNYSGFPVLMKTDMWVVMKNDSVRKAAFDKNK
ncbi:MAG: hypothetical protein KJ607_13905 [Bacteroidetes bacterium]|nr:hypothetical protein [Bacteroidota bacterium]